jgi:hypothetical protein
MGENSGWKGILGLGIIILVIMWLLKRRWGRAVVAGFFALFCYLAFSGIGTSEIHIDHREPKGLAIAVTGWVIFLSVTAIFYIFSHILERAAASHVQEENRMAEERAERSKDKLKRTQEYFQNNIVGKKRPAFNNADAYHREMAYFLYDSGWRCYLPKEWWKSIADERGDKFSELHGD